jgi:hypothetical protein
MPTIDETESDDDDWEGYESGPFCEHWCCPWSCEEVCAACGKVCSEHGDSDCAEFVNAKP